MKIWNDDNFKGLDDVARATDDDPRLHAFAEYCRLRAAGVGPQAVEALTRFIGDARRWSPDARRDFVDWLLATQHAHPEIHQLIPRPLQADVVDPTLAEWIIEEPDSPVPYRWRGIHTGETADLERALRLDEHDTIARSALALTLLRDVDHAIHHVADGAPLSDAADIRAWLTFAAQHIAALPESDTRSLLEQRHAALERLLDDWDESYHFETPVA